jgi:exopolysaccharide biosynthesis WecB/TagA/CpsF family protein
MNSKIKLLRKLNIFYTQQDVIEAINNQIMSQSKSISINFMNAHAFNMSCDDRSFYNSLMASSFLLRDGIGVEVGLKLNKMEFGANLNGTDLIPIIMNDLFKDKSIAIFGSTENEINKVKKIYSEYGFNISVTCDGFQELEHYVALLGKYPADLVVLGMGMPKQEFLSQKICQKFDHKTVISGGAIFDFISGKVVRAPQWMRKINMEWVYRLYLEPKRLFNRYVIGNFVFMFRVISLVLHKTEKNRQ